MGHGLSWQQVEVLERLAKEGVLPIATLDGPYGKYSNVDSWSPYQATRRGIITLKSRGLVDVAYAYWVWVPDTGIYQWAVLQEPSRMQRRLLTAWITDEGRAILAARNGR